jgi:hypothetical protein
VVHPLPDLPKHKNTRQIASPIMTLVTACVHTIGVALQSAARTWDLEISAVAESSAPLLKTKEPLCTYARFLGGDYQTSALALSTSTNIVTAMTHPPAPRLDEAQADGGVEPASHIDPDPVGRSLSHCIEVGSLF